MSELLEYQQQAIPFRLLQPRLQSGRAGREDGVRINTFLIETASTLLVSHEFHLSSLHILPYPTPPRCYAQQ